MSTGRGPGQREQWDEPPRRRYQQERPRADYRRNDEYYDEYEEPPKKRVRRRRRRRSTWRPLLVGCALGVFLVVAAAAVVVFLTIRSANGLGTSGGGLPGIGGSQTFTQDNSQQAQFPSGLAQLQICDKIGNVSVKVDPNAANNNVTVATKKIVHVNNASDADSAFQRINVEMQPPGTITNPLSCAPSSNTPSPTATQPATGATPGTPGATNMLLINVTMPNSGSLVQGPPDSVDVTVTVPPTLIQQAGQPPIVDVETAIGNISVDGLSGALTIKDSSGNVSVTNATLLDGSRIGTGQGNVSFNGILAIPSGTSSNAHFILQSEKGNIDVTLPSSTNVMLDANVNVGIISSEFSNISGSGSTTSYQGPLNPSSQPANATLTLDVSTGNVSIHKAS